MGTAEVTLTTDSFNISNINLLFQTVETIVTR